MSFTFKADNFALPRGCTCPVPIISIRMQVTSLLTASSFTVPCALCACAEPSVVFSFKPEPLDVCE